MTNPTPQGGEPLWSNKQLSLQAECIVAGKYGVVAVYDVLKGVRDAAAKEVKRRAATELETARATIAAQAARINELEQIIEDAKTHSLTSSFPCPLCEYDESGLVKECQMHKEIFSLFTEEQPSNE